jgi:Uma2 family endonuclease
MMAKRNSPQPDALHPGSAHRRTPSREENGTAAAKKRLRELVTSVRILDPELSREWVRQRQDRGTDGRDEVWNGIYVVPPLANNPHQTLATALAALLFQAITMEERGEVQAGANVSDRRSGWDRNFRDPDVVVALKGGKAVNCGTHLMGGPDFLIEVQSPGDETDEKLPFYSRIEVRELLIVHRDTRELRLYRHDGRELALVGPCDFRGKKWLVSEVVPLAFRRRAARGGVRTEVCRTDGKAGSWTV